MATATNGTTVVGPTPSTIQCQTIQILEPDSTLLVATSSGSADPGLDESGEIVLAAGQSEVSVTFIAQKLGNYSFEYLYVDAFGVINPGVIDPVPILQTSLGFTVDLAGAPPIIGYILRWRVVVSSVTGAVLVPGPDVPQSLYLQLPRAQPLFSIVFPVPRSGITYGFSELRVENLIDLPGQQTPIDVQVYAKSMTGFSVALSPSPPTSNYFLSVRTP